MIPKGLLTSSAAVTLALAVTGLLLSAHLDAASVSSLSYASITTQNRTNCQPGVTPPPNRVDTTDRLSLLRAHMTANNLTAYLVVMTDEHGSYSGTGHYALVNHISGFSGSNGYAVVTHRHAAVWTDGRYFLQADQQMDCNWLLMKMGEPGYPANAWDWLHDVLNASETTIGAFPNIVDKSTWANYDNNLKKQGREFVAVGKELVGEIWMTRPPKPNNHLMVHNISFAGKLWSEKLEDIRSQITEAGAHVLIVTVLEQVAWLFNLRGQDKTSSLFYAYAIVHPGSASLYLNNYTALISNTELQSHLDISATGSCLNPASAVCVNVYEYNDIYDQIRGMSNVTAWVDPTSNYAIYDAASHLNRIEQTSPIERTKSIKNPVEREKFAECIFRDSAAVVEFAAFIEDRVVKKGEQNWTELSAASKLLSIRQGYEHFQGVSFETIAAVGENAAVIHYRADNTTDTTIDTNHVFLLDSGGQYLDGTTDVTRTFHFGTPTDEEKEAYTRVLMGQIDLAQAVWPEGLYGYELDVIARLPLHRNGWDYNHGTGHGIGYFLSVHEGPGRIAKGYSSTSQPLAEGMFFSDEPGFYKDGAFGIRLESLVEVVKAQTANQFGQKPYLAFQTRTFVPYETKLIKLDMLSPSQIQWLNEYNLKCREVGEWLMDVKNNHMAHMWVLARTEPLPVGGSGGGASQSHRITPGLLVISLSLVASSIAMFLLKFH